MTSLRDFDIICDNLIIKVLLSHNGTNIAAIMCNYNGDKHTIKIDWSEIENYCSNPKSSMLDTIKSHIKNLSEEDYILLSSTSVVSLSSMDSKNPESDEYLIKKFFRGFAIILTLCYITNKYKYLKTRSLPSGLHIFTINNLKIIKMSIIMHLKCLDKDNKILKHGLDFINRWIHIFLKGDPVDKTEILVELISNYICTNKNDKSENKKSLEDRISRIENFLNLD